MLGRGFRQVREATDELTTSLNVDLTDEEKVEKSDDDELKPDGSHPKG